jgi:hypothetical protein
MLACSLDDPSCARLHQIWQRLSLRALTAPVESPELNRAAERAHRAWQRAIREAEMDGRVAPVRELSCGERGVW